MADISQLKKALKRVRAAIAEVEESGQSMSLDDGVSYTRETAVRLYEREKELCRAIARATGASPLFAPVKMKTMYN